MGAGVGDISKRTYRRKLSNSSNLTTPTSPSPSPGLYLLRLIVCRTVCGRPAAKVKAVNSLSVRVNFSRPCLNICHSSSHSTYDSGLNLIIYGHYEHSFGFIYVEFIS